LSQANTKESLASENERRAASIAKRAISQEEYDVAKLICFYESAKPVD
jgi:membrane fusion protein (multidrug efflux system)